MIRTPFSDKTWTVVVSTLMLLVLPGCAKLAHMQELLTLKDYSQEKDDQEQYVTARDRQFENLRQAVHSGSIWDDPDQDRIQDAFGSPVFAGENPDPDDPGTVWMYRYQTRLLDSEKVYLTFNADGRLQEAYVQAAGDDQGEDHEQD